MGEDETIQGKVQQLAVLKKKGSFFRDYVALFSVGTWQTSLLFSASVKRKRPRRYLVPGPLKEKKGEKIEVIDRLLKATFLLVILFMVIYFLVTIRKVCGIPQFKRLVLGDFLN